ncbi:hypothetical protein LTR17_005431 [Elasticomyces elasticus]|nr:hypothetical protein LTR17_005431 [Elasticomyces elasticus]
MGTERSRDRNIVTLKRCLGFKITRTTSHKKIPIKSAELAELWEGVDLLKDQHRNATSSEIRRSEQIEAACVILLDKFGSSTWPDPPQRATADWLAVAGEDNLADLYPVDLYWSKTEHRSRLRQLFLKLVVGKCINTAKHSKQKATQVRQQQETGSDRSGFVDTLLSEQARSASPSERPVPLSPDSVEKSASMASRHQTPRPQDRSSLPPKPCSNASSQRSGDSQANGAGYARAPSSNDNSHRSTTHHSPSPSRPHLRSPIGDAKRPYRAEQVDEGPNNQKKAKTDTSGPRPVMAPPPQAVMGAPRTSSDHIISESNTNADPRLRQQSVASSTTVSPTGPQVANRSARKELSVRVKYMLDDQKVGRQRCIRVTGYDNAAAFFRRLDGKVPFHARNEGHTVVLVAVEGIQEMEDMAFERELNEEEWELFQTCLEDMTSTGKPLDGSVKLVADLSSGVSKMET